MASRPHADIKHNSDGSVLIQYQPKQSGAHEVNVSYNDIAVTGTPLRVNVDAVNGKYITAYGQGLNQGGSGEQLEFFVTGDEKDIAVKIDGPGKADILKKESKGGILAVTYMPVTPGEYDVHITYKGKPVHGSPFPVKVSGEGRKRSQMSFPASSEYTLGGANIDLTGMLGLVKTPGGASEPCLLKRTGDGKLGISSFQPKKKGTYVVEVTQDGKTYQGSPFKIDVTDSQCACAAKVKVTGAVRDAKANEPNEVSIHVGDAGFGALGFSIEGGHRSDLEMKSSTKSDVVLTYSPHEPGIYLINIKFADDHVSGSPFLVNVSGQPSGRVRETKSIQVQHPEVVFPNQACTIQLKVPGTDPLDMESTLTSPSGKSEMCEIRGGNDWLCNIKFTPTEEGVHTISIKYKGLHFAGSPYQYTVGKPPSGGAHKVEFGGPGVEKGEVGAKNEFNVYHREGGAGTISVSIEGPSQAKMELVDRGYGYSTVAYEVTRPGDYGIHVKLNDEHVPESPATVFVAPESRDAKKISLSGLKDRGLEIGKPVHFNIDMNGARGDLKAFLNSPSGTEEDVFITNMDDDARSLRFLPKENGVYYVHIKFNDAHITGSPLPMLVGKIGADPALVFANGDGLNKAESGKPTKFMVVTNNAGAAVLGVIIDGPSKVPMTCTEVADGYEIGYTPMAPGSYMILIKYANVTIAGAPFKAIVSGTGKGSDISIASELHVEAVEKKPGVSKAKKFVGDATRVVAQGNGLKKGFVGRPSTFTLDVKDAGQALLTVGMMGPSGNPLPELSYKRAKNTVTVSYKAEEKGDHAITIRWGADDIPGSPFVIGVA